MFPCDLTGFWDDAQQACCKETNMMMTFSGIPVLSDVLVAYLTQMNDYPICSSIEQTLNPKRQGPVRGTNWNMAEWYPGRVHGLIGPRSPHRTAVWICGRRQCIPLEGSAKDFLEEVALGLGIIGGRTEYVVMEGRSFWAKAKNRGLTEDVVACVGNSVQRDVRVYAKLPCRRIRRGGGSTHSL